MKKLTLLVSAFILQCASTPVIRGDVKQPDNYYYARKALKEKYREGGTTFYCNCRFAYEEKSGRYRVDHDSCAYRPRNETRRSLYVEWEHVIPASRLGSHLTAWQNGAEECVTSAGREFKGRRCARRAVTTFRQMEADLNNLKPVIGEVNASRGDFDYGEIDGEEYIFGNCDFEIDYERDLAEPRDAIRDDIAAIYRYMQQKYNLKLTPAEEQMVESWE